MIARIIGDRRSQAITRRIDRPEALAVAIVQTAIAAAGWLVESPIWLAVAIAGQLAVGGFGAVRVIGPAQSGLGLARYALPATAGVAATLFGRILGGGTALVLVPLIAVLLWTVLYLELRSARLAGGRTIQELLLTAVLFTAASGIRTMLEAVSWQISLLLIAVVAAILSMRSAEARGFAGATAVGQALLQTLAVMQVAAAMLLLDLPGLVPAAIIGLTLYAWGGATEALSGGATGRSVGIEFGALAALGLVVALLARGF